MRYPVGSVRTALSNCSRRLGQNMRAMRRRRARPLASYDPAAWIDGRDSEEPGPER